jgi:hypothetical protein
MNNLIIYPFPYCIPDESIVDYDSIKNEKHVIISDLIPGKRETYRFGADDEKEYNKHYQESLFAYTQKKGGWDCLRHYEILANGCIPIFEDIDQCPPYTLNTLPKELIKESNNKLLPYKEEFKDLYHKYAYKIFDHVKQNCTSSAATKFFLEKMDLGIDKNIKNVLLVRCHSGVNYTRELFWIGMKRHIQSQKGVAVEYPKIDFLYESYNGSNKDLYGFGFNYAKKLKDDYDYTNEEMIEKIKSRFWDIVIYGKIGPDELLEGSMPNLPLWEHVSQNYKKEEIAFLYGGDECIDLTYDNRYSRHISYHGQFGKCFVRELKL